MMHLENFMLRERSQSHKTDYYVIPFIGKSIETESRLVAARSRGGGTRKGLLTGYEIFVWNGETVLELDGGDGCTLYRCT